MPTVVTRYLNTASAGGDGTTNGTSGSTAAYATLEAARADLISDFPDLTSADVQVDLICSGATDDNTAVTNTWPTSDSTRYLHIQAPAADRKVTWDASVYTLAVLAAGGNALTLNTNSMRLTGVQIHQASNANASEVLEITGLGGVLVLDGVKLRGTNAANSVALRASGVGGIYVVRNCISWQNINGFVLGNATGLPANSEVYCYNNTIIGVNSTQGEALFLVAASSSGTIVRAKNNLMQNLVHGLTATGWGTSDNSHNVHDIGITATFVDTTVGNFSLDPSDTVALDQGTDLSGVADWPFDIDANGFLRHLGGSWDIGAHELGSTTPPGGRRFYATLIG